MITSILIKSVNTSQHESTRVNTSPIRVNTSPTRVNTNQHEFDTSPTRVKTNQYESNTSQLDQEIIIAYCSLVGKV